MHVIFQVDELRMNIDGPTLWRKLDAGDSAVTNEQTKQNEETLEQTGRLTVNTALGICIHKRLFTKFITTIIFNRANWLKLMNSGCNRFESPSGYRIS